MSVYSAATNSCYEQSSTSSVMTDPVFEIETPVGTISLCRPSEEVVERTVSIAKSIFVEAFSTTYIEYHRQSQSTDSIERWLRLKTGSTVQSWLKDTFDGEYEEYKAHKKSFVYFYDSKNNLIGWMSHSPVSESGDVYLSQGSLEASFRNQKVATFALANVLKKESIVHLFPGVREIKLITRTINQFAKQLYLAAGFKQDENIDPSVYGDCYDERYTGFRLAVDKLS